MDIKRILVINPGSTSTKVAVYENERCVLKTDAAHDISETEENIIAGKYTSEFIDRQIAERNKSIRSVLEEANINTCSFDAVVARGGAIIGADPGAYIVDGYMKEYLRSFPAPWHDSNYGALMADVFADESGCNAYVYDAPTADQMIDKARITGYKGHYRFGGGHVLNHRACAIRYAKEKGAELEDLRLITAHLGGGCTLMAFIDGKMADVCGDLEGTYSPGRGGFISTQHAMEMAVREKMTLADVHRKCRGGSGIGALLGTADMRKVEEMIEAGDSWAELVFDGMMYNISKSIGALAAAPMRGKVDAVIITGGIAFSTRAVETIKGYIEPLASEIVVYPGEEELNSLSQGILRVLRGEEISKKYTEEESKRQRFVL